MKKLWSTSSETELVQGMESSEEEAGKFKKIIAKYDHRGFVSLTPLLIDSRADAGDFEGVRWLAEIEPGTCDEITMGHACRGGHLNIVKWINERGRSWRYETYLAAGDHRQILMWLKIKGCPFSRTPSYSELRLDHAQREELRKEYETEFGPL